MTSLTDRVDALIAQWDRSDSPGRVPAVVTAICANRGVIRLDESINESAHNLTLGSPYERHSPLFRKIIQEQGELFA